MKWPEKAKKYTLELHIFSLFHATLKFSYTKPYLDNLLFCSSTLATPGLSPIEHEGCDT